MIALLQRVNSASVTVNGEKIARIPQGLLVLLGVEKKDDEITVDRLADKILKYRVFADADDKMNLSVLDIKGSVLMVPSLPCRRIRKRDLGRVFQMQLTRKKDSRCLPNLLI